MSLNVLAISSSGSIVPKVLRIALSALLKACFPVKIFAPFTSISFLNSSSNSNFPGCLNPWQCVTTTVTLPLKVLAALAPVSPVEETTIMLVIFSLAMYSLTTFKRASVFCPPASSK
jgi:hypothetical protein